MKPVRPVDKPGPSTGDGIKPLQAFVAVVLHHVNDEEDPAGIVRHWRDKA
ncbi:hypothetical protein ACFY64_17450 [Streptomyces collinus]